MSALPPLETSEMIMNVMWVIVIMILMATMMMMMMMTCTWLQEELQQWKSQSECPPRLGIIVMAYQQITTSHITNFGM